MTEEGAWVLRDGRGSGGIGAGCGAEQQAGECAKHQRCGFTECLHVVSDTSMRRLVHSGRGDALLRLYNQA